MRGEEPLFPVATWYIVRLMPAKKQTPKSATPKPKSPTDPKPGDSGPGTTSKATPRVRATGKPAGAGKPSRPAVGKYGPQGPMIESSRRRARWYGGNDDHPMPDKGKVSRTAIKDGRAATGGARTATRVDRGGGGVGRGIGGGGGGRGGGGRLFARGK